MNLYIVTNTSFNDRDKKRFGIDFFLSKDIKVHVIDVQNYTNPELNSIEKNSYLAMKNLNVSKCCSFKDVKNIVEKNGEGIALLFLSDNIQSIKIIKFLQTKGIKIGILQGGMLPIVPSDKNTLFKIIGKFETLKIRDFLNLLFTKLYSNILKPKKYDFLITSNYSQSVENYGTSAVTSVIETHCLDYDLFLENKDKTNLKKIKYVVFLDQYLLDHSDFIRSKAELHISREKYFLELNRLFEYIENKFNYKVIIAAHPRANIKDYTRLFDGREVIFGKSALLVKYCEFSITHYSTAINFSVIYNKPILFITSDDLNHTFIAKYIKYFSSLLKQDIVNISNKNLFIKEQNINKKCYEEYKYKYIKKNDIEELSYSIFYNTYLKENI